MSMTPTYQAANIAAPLVEEHFKRYLSEARRMGEDGLAPQPDARSIASIINATFWASFRPEEGRFPKISIAYLPPEQAGQPMMFEHPLPLTAGVLTKLAPAVERPEIHLGVWNHGDELRVWGTTQRFRASVLCLKISSLVCSLLSTVVSTALESMRTWPCSKASR